MQENDIFQMLYDNKISREDALLFLEKMNDTKQEQHTSVREECTAKSIPIREEVERIVRNALHVDEKLQDEMTFKEIGVDSILAVEIVREINKNYHLNMDMVVIYDHPSIAELSEYVESLMIQTASKPVSVQETPPVDDTEHIERALKKTVSEILHIAEEDLNLEQSFREFGVDSITGIEIIREMNKEFQINMDSVEIYEYPTITDMVNHIQSLIGPTQKAAGTEQVKDVYHDEHYLEMRQKYIQRTDTQYHGDSTAKTVSKISLKSLDKKKIVHYPSCSQDNLKEKSAVNILKPLKLKTAVTESIPVTAKAEDFPKPSEDAYRKVAIIGMSGKFPNAGSLREYWYNIQGGVDCISEIPASRWNHEEYYDSDPKAPNKTNTKWMGVVPDIDQFDPLFFNISPLEAETMDPQQRLFLMEAWSALEDAGYSSKKLNGLTCGVFVGATQSDYTKIIEEGVVSNPMDVFTGVSPSILAARISYFLNLTGPSVSIDTACSSSLVAIHEACQSIHAGDSSMAIAGGVRLIMTPDLLIQSSKAGIMSPTGKCRAFGQDADGIVLSDGVGAIVLKDYEQAIKDHDHIYGVIRASGINQDGRTNGITAPSAQSQTKLEQKVLRQAGVNAEDITLVETHGTGTKLGDPIEVSALKETFGRMTDKKHFCALSSVKANIGHASMAAGVAGVIKVLLAMKYKKIPPQIHVDQVNEHINLEDSPFYISTKLTEWKLENGRPRIATVSSFGFSGTNCYIVLEEAVKSE